MQKIISSQEVRNEVSVMFAVLALWDCLEDNPALVAFLVQIKQGCFIIHSVTIIGR